MIRAKIFIRYAAIFSILVSVLVIIGWFYNISVLKTIVPGYDSMKFNSAICILLCGISLTTISVDKKNFSAISKITAMLVLIIAIATLLEYVFNKNFGIDELIVIDDKPEGLISPFPGRMAYTTVFCYLLLGYGLINARSKMSSIRWIAQHSFHVVSFISFIAITGYLLNIPRFYTLAFLNTMALHTATLVFLLSIASSALIPDKGYAKLFMNNRIGNIMARRLFPIMAVSVLMLSVLRLETHWHQMISVEMGIALFGTTFILVSLFLIDNTASKLNHIDSKRAIAEKQLMELNLELEKKIDTRTKELSESNERLKNFAHIVSHNLRSHSGNISTLLTLAVEDHPNLKDDELMTLLIMASDNLTETITHLTEVVAMNTSVSDNLKRLNLKKYVQQAIQNVNALAKEAHVKIEDNVDERLFITGVEAYLDSIILNFLTNGIKYRSPDRNSYIRLNSSVAQGFVILSFEDNGIGMDMEKVGNKLFGMYKTFHNNSDARGIGLFITKNQIESMGGKVEVESTLDKGTTFKIYLKHEKD